jgi:hypothetical protein
MLINIMSNEIMITNLDIIKPHYDFVDIKIPDDKWKPLEFWFNKDTSLALPMIAIKYIQEDKEIQYNFAPISSLLDPEHISQREP